MNMQCLRPTRMLRQTVYYCTMCNSCAESYARDYRCWNCNNNKFLFNGRIITNEDSTNDADGFNEATCADDLDEANDGSLL